MANTILNKNTDLNNICKDYSIVVSDNSYILNYNASLIKLDYDKKTLQGNILPYLELNEVNKVNNFQTTYHIKNEFNFNYSYYQSDYILQGNSLIISSLSDNDISSYFNSYIVFYNTESGLKQLSYHFKEGNGLYYDNDNHVVRLNIDNKSIKEINKKLFFDTNSIQISSDDNYGISYIDSKYLKINNGTLSIDLSYIETIISHKYKIQNLYQKINSLYNSLSYYNYVNDIKNNTIDEFKENFDIVNTKTEYDAINKSITQSISYQKESTLYFPINEIKYIDNYYFENDLIDKAYKQYISLNDDNSYIIYCKDLEQLEILSYIENKYLNYSTEFDVNKIKDIEFELLNNDNIVDVSDISTSIDFNKYINNNCLETVNSTDLYSYIYSDDTNNYNKFILKSNIVNKTVYGDNYQITNNKFIYPSKIVDEKIFKQLGIVLNSKISLPQIKKNKIEYIKNGTEIKYNYIVQTINCKYNSKNIKVLYDNRDIAYCTYNTKAIDNSNQNKYYFLSPYNYTSSINIDNNIDFIMKNTDICFNNNGSSYLFYGYNFSMNSEQIFKKKYYSIWNNYPTCFITEYFMKLLINRKNSVISSKQIVLNNFKELYTQNFNNIEYDKNNYQPVTLYFYELYQNNITKLPNITINI